MNMLTLPNKKMIAEVAVETGPAEEPQETPEQEPPEQEPPEQEPPDAEGGQLRCHPPEHEGDVEIEVEDVPEPKRRAKAKPKAKAAPKAAPKKAPAAPKPRPRKPKETPVPSTRSVALPQGRFDAFSSLELAAELLHRRQTSAREQKRLVYKSWLE
jgi:outer membrane biosynthesis protein TonB